ncbi:hypothetical protein [Aestuariibius sp. HNIBRBA575]|uniref:hypothetical protein n=1 Tax=Aestuariibius sp. HNIBRBA575 TaxID=3233343 RepID=UPI0034A5CD1C
MGLAYALIALFMYGVPLLGLFVLWLFVRFAMKGVPLRGVLALGIVAVVAAIPILKEQYELRRDLAVLEMWEMRPTQLSPLPGSLLTIDSYAGGCRYVCPDLTEASFVTSVTHAKGGSMLEPSYEPITEGDLWTVLDDPDRSQPFPYDYVLLMVPAFVLPEVIPYSDYRVPGWPDGVNTAVVLVRAPVDGILDLRESDILYKRLELQRDMTQYPFWPYATDTRWTPSVVSLIEEIIALSHL